MLDEIHKAIVQDISIGIVVLDSGFHILLWNKFLEQHSGITESEVHGQNIFDIFPYLPKDWLTMKLRSVFLLKNFSFTSWKQRPYLFKFFHNRPITGTVDNMYQDCIFLPIQNGAGITYACIAIQDMTDVAIYEQQLEEMKEINTALEQMVNHDVLTSAFNRRHVEGQLLVEFGTAKRYNRPFSVLMMDIDFFKKINDTYGHPAGDEVLRKVSKIIQFELRTSDIMGRYGGEEFIALLPETDHTGTLIVAERIREKIESAVIAFEDKTIRCTISLGISYFRSGLNDYHQLIQEADIALYNSKKGGRNRTTVYNEPS